MSSVKDDAVVVNSQLRHSVSTLWFFLTFEFLISTFLSIFLAILTFIKSLLPKPPRDLTGDIILIAGVSSSLGESLASEFLKNGCSVICVDKDSKTIEETVTRLKQRHLIVEPRQRRSNDDSLSRSGSMIFTYECDFLDKDAIRGTVQKVKKDIGRIDVLITCINETNENIFDASNRTLMAHFWTVLTFLPMMLYQKRGHIIGVTPIALNSDAYHSSRAAIMYFIESMRQELSEHSSYLTFLAYSPIAKSSSLKQNEEEVSKNIVRAVKTDQYNVSWTFKLLYQIGCIIYNGITLLTNWIDFNRCDYPT
ncbi:retinol dehydrogenase 10-A isoform X2 [Apis mellifera caucasica]|nr:retinol dehydrogenase 10-A isoform X2 [Apis mellifera]XP_006561754.1 retinol dehydrogenase 10-A isoform X2 [Apis mellifera]XP_006561755.1 retinol dehydrogenase 10-A isoform X2 [Apis mellifera]XP_016769541.1 retinol dehydrogenase 10-A isoform X2 [Apis mellifera]KAG6801349.1 retinol dehydrogenase 10-A isoform X2 [Apis mellifera caucasica]KAG9431317.1 retinol dehydrogenase 10-A isoform X2 [Apis mellifera carnica]|eukprot:XP_006561753.1 retinol dehydrogenase 10-A isoform X2 [Apis mellifera]